MDHLRVASCEAILLRQHWGSCIAMPALENDDVGGSPISGGLEAMYILWGDDIFSDPFYYSLSEDAQIELNEIARRVRIIGREERRAQIIAKNSANSQGADDESSQSQREKSSADSHKSGFWWNDFFYSDIRIFAVGFRFLNDILAHLYYDLFFEKLSGTSRPSSRLHFEAVGLKFYPDFILDSVKITILRLDCRDPKFQTQLGKEITLEDWTNLNLSGATS